jgi:Flp pilus assembly protein TadG
MRRIRRAVDIATVTRDRQPDRGRRARWRKDGGAAAVEFALILPVLIALVCGIIDFGLIFGQHLQVRNLAREATRLAAVNEVSGSTATQRATFLVNRACSRAGVFPTGTQVSLERPGSAVVGSTVRVVVTSPMRSSTGVFTSLVGGRNQQARSEARLEQPATWATTTVNCP